MIYDTVCIFCRGTGVEGSWHEDTNCLAFGCIFVILMASSSSVIGTVPQSGSGSQEWVGRQPETGSLDL